VPIDLTTLDPGSVLDHRVTGALLDHVAGIADACAAAAVFVSEEAVGSRSLSWPPGFRRRVVYMTTCATEDELGGGDGICIKLPDVPLTRMGQIKIAVFLAVTRGIVAGGDVIVFLSGVAGSGMLDMLFVTQIDREAEMFAFLPEGQPLPEAMHAEVLARVVDIATEIGVEGREGKPVGALFVIGDATKVLTLSRPLVLNPFRGYDERERNVLDVAIEETIKEFSAIDGAFVIRGDGVIEACGVLLKTLASGGAELHQGLGARHHVAAGITAVTDSIAISISESTGTVTIFRGGQMVTEIEKPRHFNPT